MIAVGSGVAGSNGSEIGTSEAGVAVNAARSSGASVGAGEDRVESGAAGSSGCAIVTGEGKGTVGAGEVVWAIGVIHSERLGSVTPQALIASITVVRQSPDLRCIASSFAFVDLIIERGK